MKRQDPFFGVASCPRRRGFRIPSPGGNAPRQLSAASKSRVTTHLDSPNPTSRAESTTPSGMAWEISVKAAATGSYGNYLSSQGGRPLQNRQVHSMGLSVQDVPDRISISDSGGRSLDGSEHGPGRAGPAAALPQPGPEGAGVAGLTAEGSPPHSPLSGWSKQTV